jgi:hypothetical protein
MSGPDAADPPAPAPQNPHDVALGSPPAFVAPRTYLEQARPIVPPKPMSAVDREQMEGLVGTGSCGKLEEQADQLPEVYTRIPQSADELRCAASQLQADCPGHGPPGQEELEYIEPERLVTGAP